MTDDKKRDSRYIECFGGINGDSRKCQNCSIGKECYDLTNEISNNQEFKPGKYRRGFGKPGRDKKRELPE